MIEIEILLVNYLLNVLLCCVFVKVLAIMLNTFQREKRVKNIGYYNFLKTLCTGKTLGTGRHTILTL